MKDLAADVAALTAFLAEHGRAMLGEVGAPRRVDIRPVQTAFIATLDFEAGRRRIVAKSVSGDANISRPEDLSAIHRAIRSRCATLANGLPRFYETRTGSRWLMMEYISGSPLDRLLGMSLRRSGVADDDCVGPLARTAEVQAALQGVLAADVGLHAAPRRNHSYIAHFEAAWAVARGDRLFPREYAQPIVLYRHIKLSFYDRLGESVLAGDIQPKNLMVKDSGEVVFIDLDYIAGNPAIGLSQFLVGMDRLGLRHPLRSSFDRIARWKRRYLAEYFRRSPGWVSEDVLFFYPWMLLQNYQLHATIRPWCRPYLRIHYSRCLREFLERLALHSPGRPPRCAAEFLAGDAYGERRRAATSTSRVGEEPPPTPSRDSVEVPLLLEGFDRSVPGRFLASGLPFPRGRLTEPAGLALRGARGREVPAQVEPLAWWGDGSVKWLLVETLLGPLTEDEGPWTLARVADPTDAPPSELLRVETGPESFSVVTGPAEFEIGRGGYPLMRARVGGLDVLKPGGSRIVLTDAAGREVAPRVHSAALEVCGSVRATVRVEGRFEGRAGCRFLARFCFFAGTGMVRVRLTVHNPRRARHPGGIWDLGDSGSILFRDISMEFTLAGAGVPQVSWSAEQGQRGRSMVGGVLEIYQDTSGGENWQSRNHVNRNGRVPCTFRGYRVRADGREDSGLRANPTVSVHGSAKRITMAIPEFWQQFPKAVEVEARTLRVRLFPHQFGDFFELQGGEQKTHTFWLEFGADAGCPEGVLDWVHRPAHLRATPEWYAASGVIPHLTPADPGDRLDTMLAGVVEGPRSFSARREIIDEYGWRHFGEVYADHEAANCRGEAPIVSHYNNQYDIIYGMIMRYFRTGDSRWFELLDQLSRHIIDIDIYHTDRDKSAYNGGLFWHTDHYRDAATCTHRAFSRANRPAGAGDYGGGPSAEHNYTTGLLHYHYLTGDEDARAAVLGLAEWVVNMDDGRLSVFGLLDLSPTGSASRTAEWGYHGPGRGCGNSINALLDGWLLSGRRAYLEKAEALIRRTIHPSDDVAARGLLRTETRWSYTVYLSNLARYLAQKAEAGELDGMYAYARAALLQYASWMLTHEVPYFDRPEQLEFPTETWAAQDLRKANVLRLASAHADEPLRSRLRDKGDALADRAWADLLKFGTRDVARSVAIVLREGSVDAGLRAGAIAPAPAPPAGCDFGEPERFVAQKDRIRDRLRTPRGLVSAAARLAASLLGRRPR